MTICEKIFAIMDEKNKRAVDLCRILDVGTSTMTTWKKRNTDPPAKYLAQICEFLEISINELLEIEDNSQDEDEKELLKYFNMLPEKEKYKWIGRIEEAASRYEQEPDQHA